MENGKQKESGRKGGRGTEGEAEERTRGPTNSTTRRQSSSRHGSRTQDARQQQQQQQSALSAAACVECVARPVNSLERSSDQLEPPILPARRDVTDACITPCMTLRNHRIVNYGVLRGLELRAEQGFLAMSKRNLKVRIRSSDIPHLRAEFGNRKTSNFDSK
ncbi:hypothetical protein EAI_00607 [Harpegnathos saltator]|uniref:Uncharacterized protein n=1 Tax=Harpegnathos saltator TaxID=610380 RepID=E2BMH8_HARSA|nr:hypothetical protein EAI_00607 [Harpegnathos saltator]